ncbi:hypothetical protein QQF64_016249 [Cirrhinus molitorella]|uniref:Uncharacterized protein n=1 Tax=Cirrhinus molitorella TaxID=172907 RepID=A0ABR3LNZ3_9TELE
MIHSRSLTPEVSLKRLFLCVQIVYPILPMSVMHLVSKYGHYERTVTGGLCGKLMATEKGKKDRTAASVTTGVRLQALGGFRCSCGPNDDGRHMTMTPHPSAPLSSPSHAFVGRERVLLQAGRPNFNR